jgi:OmpA-OmpF porin, OOP family
MKKHFSLLGVLGVCSAVLSFNAPAQIVDVDVGDAPEPEEGDSSDDQGGDRRMYISPMFSYTMSDQDRLTGDAIGGVLSVGKRFTSGLNLELTGFWQQMDAETTGGTASETAELIGVGAAAMIFPSQTLSNLYVIVALHQGQANKHPTSTPGATMDYTTTIFDPGLGYIIPLSPYLGGFEMALRLEARYRMDAHTRTAAGEGGNKHFYEGVGNIGVMIPLGKLPVEAAPAEVEVVEAAAPTDADGDGVADDQDQCPDTAAGSQVNEQGCEGDTDADGVVDRLDTCPDTPAGTAVNEQGCAAVADADGDGVPDDKDKCPDTATGSTVDENGCAPQTGCRAPAPGEPINLEGCATGESVVLKGVNFEVNSSRLTANAKVILNQVADSLTATPSMKVEIGGHTDNQGSDDFNQKLSERRAQSVHDYLVARGIDSSRLSAKGYGESQPVDTNETPEGRELNRRVEMKVLEGGTQ